MVTQNFSSRRLNRIMSAGLRRLFLTGGLVLLASCAAWAQTTTLEGDVKDENGQPMKNKGATIVLNRTDIKGHYEVKNDKKGHWLYTGLPFGKYDVECQIDGKTVDSVRGVQSSYSDAKPIDFDLSKLKAQQAATQQANSSGQLTQDQSRAMSKEQKEQYEAQLKKNAESMKKNKALNDAFNAAQDQMKLAAAEPDKAKQIPAYQTAIDNLNKASELDANQVAVWNALGEAYASMGRAQTGDERNKTFEQAIGAYNKSLALKPNEAGVYNQIGNLYGSQKKIPEATEALNKAAQLDPGMAPKAYFNMGANLVNGGQPEKASEFFKKAADADPNYAEAWYQFGSLQMMQGKIDAKTGSQEYPPDTATALKKYLELQPTGTHAGVATAMLLAMCEKVEPKVSIPQPAKKKK
jgi:tetratricopeptide (TPR) repeat protein